MAPPTAAQEEFNDLVDKNASAGRDAARHPEDRDDPELQPEQDLSEEESYRNAQIDAAMRMPTGAAELNLPPASFDSGRFTGVKGVIADARSYETARKSKWMDRARNARRSILGFAGVGNGHSTNGSKSESETDDEARSDEDEETFLSQWRESRRRELESEVNRAVRTRKTSPSVRIYGRLDEVDALGYLDAIEKVGRETVVVVFVYDHEVSPAWMDADVFCRRRHANIIGNSARYRQPLKMPSCLLSRPIRRCTLSRFTTRRLSLTTLRCRPCWPTATRATCLPT